MRSRWLCAACVMAGVLAVLGPRPAAQDDADAVARRQLGSGLRHLEEGKYDEAMRDLERVVKESPRSPAAAEALFAIARYQLLVLRQPDLATVTINDLNQRFPGSEAAASAQVLRGQIPLAKRREAKDIDQAVAEFLRVPAIYPHRPEAQQQALYYAGETLRMAAAWDTALQQYKTLLRRFPRSQLASAALIGAGQCAVAMGKPYEAMQDFQRARNAAPDTRDAARALDLNAIAYRLYTPTSTPYTLSSASVTTAKIDDVMALRFDHDGRLVLVHRNGLSIMSPELKPTRQVSGRDARGVLFDFTRPVLVTEKGLVPEGSPMVLLHVPRPGEQARTVENIEDAVITSVGEILVADRGAKAISRFAPDGSHIGPFASVQATRLAIAETTDTVAAVDGSTKTVKVFGRDGRLVGAATGGADGFDRPVALAYDVLGHLYVLDAGRAAVHVFDGNRKLLRTFTVPEKSAGSFRRARALAVDGAGRLFIYDERGGLLVFE